MRQSLQIREAESRDRPQLIQFMADLQEVERSLHSSRSRGMAIAAAHLSYLEQLVQQQHGRIVVAENETGLLGFVVCFVEALDEGDRHLIESERRFGYISDLYVTEAARGQGVGVALIQAGEAHFTSLRLSTVRIGVLHNNQVARRLYERIGYRPYEVTYEKQIAD